MKTMSGGPCLHYDCTNRNSFGYCKTTACINPKYSNIGTAQYGQGVQKRIATNADRIRSMTDEELAMWINDVTTNALSVLALGSNKQTKTIFYWLDWLKQEAK